VTLSTKGILHISLLGTFVVRAGDTLVTTLNTPRLQSLLAYLILNRSVPQARQRVAFLLWPDSTEAKALASLRKHLHKLRQALPDADRYLVSDKLSVQWRASSSCVLDLDLYERALDEAEAVAGDEQALEALERAANLYGGELLPTCYEEWILPERERLQQSFVRAVERLIEGLKGRQEYGRAIEHARHLLRHDPIREATYRQLMELLALEGDHAEALRVYEACRAMLRNELDVEVSPATEEMYRQIVGGGVPRPPAKSAPVAVAERPPTPTNLPFPPNEFIGREGEVAALRMLVERDGVRLVTLTGPPGIGKTRLALRVAAGFLDHFTDGVYFVPLAAISDPELVVSAIAQKLGLREAAGRPLLELLQEHLRHKKLLLILDNYEQVMQTAPLVAELVSSGRLLNVLVTSREPLHLYGEHEFAVPPLELPDLTLSLAQGNGRGPEHGETNGEERAERRRMLDVEEVGRYSAVRLFVERANAAQAGFTLTPDNAQVVSAICHRLEGIPLAIELAATRIRLMSPQALVSRLDRRLQELRSDARDLPRRLQTLRDAIAWSYDLLDPAEKVLFRRLGVFVGGWTPEAAEVITRHAGEGANVQEQLRSLADKSLLTVEDAGADGLRFSMLETIREYALEVLEEHEEREGIRRRHALYFVDWAEEAEAQLRGPEQIVWMERMQRDHDNLRAASGWAHEHEDAELALRLAVALGRFRERRGYWGEARRSLEMALDLAELAGPLRQSSLAGMALLRLARIMVQQGDYLPAEEHLRESLSVFKEAGDKAGMALALNNLGQLYDRQGRQAEAFAHHQESLALSRESGDVQSIALSLNEVAVMSSQMGDQVSARRYFEECLELYRTTGNKQGIAISLLNLGVVAGRQRDYEAARPYYEQSLTVSRELGNRGDVALILRNLSDLLCDQGDQVKAVELCEESLHLSRELGSKELVAQCIVSFARIAAEKGQWLLAARLFGAGQAQLDAIGAHLYGPAQERVEYGVQLVITQLGDATWQAYHAEGGALTAEEATTEALRLTDS
jgi:predicted ATPase/DNA-binding SARP family transcriptional activator